MMAEATGAAQKEHGGREALGDDHGVVACAAGHSAAGKASPIGGGLKELGKKWTQRNGRLLQLSLRADLYAAFCCSGVCDIYQGGHGRLASLVVRMAHVERGGDSSGDDVAGSRRCLHFADGSDETGVGVG